MTCEEIRNSVADALTRIGHGNPDFVEAVRNGEHDDGPFMFGAFAVHGEIARRDREADNDI